MKEGLGKEDDCGCAHSSVNTVKYPTIGEGKERVKTTPKPSKGSRKWSQNRA